MEAAGVGMYLSDGCSLREVGSEVTPGSMGRWLVEDCGKSGFTGAQAHTKALPRSRITDGNRMPGVGGQYIQLN